MKHHTSITLSFLVIGHTKFAPDWCFGLFKRHFRQTKIGNLKGIAQAVNDSAECNFAQMVCNEDGSTIVPTYDWTTFAPQLKKIAGIKKYHHFRCDSSKPGCVYVKEHADTVEVKIDLMKHSPCWSPDPKELPSVVLPKGVCQWRDSGTSTTVSVPFVLMVIRIPLVLCLTYPNQVVHQAHQLNQHSHLLTAIMSLHPNANVCVAPVGKKGTIIALVQTRRFNELLA